MALRLDTSSTSSEKVTLERFSQLTRLGDIRDELLKASTFCVGNVKIAERIQELTQVLATRLELKYQHSKLQGYLDGGETLQVRVRNTIDLVGTPFPISIYAHKLQAR